MWAKIIGSIAIFFGVLWIIWPQLLRGWLVRKTSRTIFWTLVFAFFFPLVAWTGKQGLRDGWIFAILLFCAVGFVLGRFLGRMAEKIPLVAFRAAGLTNLASGLALVFLRK